MVYCYYNQNIFSHNYGNKIILNAWCHKQSINLEKMMMMYIILLLINESAAEKIELFCKLYGHTLINRPAKQLVNTFI